MPPVARSLDGEPGGRFSRVLHRTGAHNLRAGGDHYRPQGAVQHREEVWRLPEARHASGYGDRDRLLSVLAVGETPERKRSVRIALGAVAPTPIRAKAAEALLYGREITPELSDKAGRLAAEEARPVTDVRGSDWYRERMVSVLVSEALQEISRKTV